MSARLKECQKIDYGARVGKEKGGSKGQKDDHHQVTKRYDLRYILDRERPME